MMGKKQYYCRVKYKIFQVYIFGIFLVQLYAVQYYFPLMNTTHSYTKKYQSNFSQIIKYNAHGGITNQLYENRTLLFTDVLASRAFQRVFFNPNNNNSDSLLKDQILIDFAVDDSYDIELYFLVNSSEIIQYLPYMSAQINRTSINNIQFDENSILKTTNQTFYILNTNKTVNETVKFNRILREDNILKRDPSVNLSTIYPNQTFTNVTGDQVRASVCKMYWSTTQYIAIWNQFSFIQIYSCQYDQCTWMATIDQQVYNQSWVTDQILFGSACSYIYVEYDQYLPARKYDLTGKLKTQYLINQSIHSFSNIGQSNNDGSIIFSNGSFILVSLVQNNTFIYQYEQSYYENYSQWNRHVWGSRRITINYQTQIKSVKLYCWHMMYFDWWKGECRNCSIYCTSCNEGNGHCITCILDYYLNVTTGQCLPIIHNYTNYTLNQTNPLKYGALFDYEQLTATIAVKGFDLVLIVIQKLFIFFQFLPIVWLFLNFMNFWTICSLYVFLNADIPEYLEIILSLIYQKTNVSILNTDQWANRIYSVSQKLDLQQYQITSSFVTNNLQGMIFFLFTTLTAGVICYFLKNVSFKSRLYKKLCNWINFETIVTNQFIAAGTSYILPFPLIFYQLNRGDFIQTVNFILHLSFMGVCLIFPFLVSNKLIKNSNLVKTTRKVIQSFEEQQKRQLNQILQWIYGSNCNTLLPFIIILGFNNFFYFFGFLFYSVGIWIAFKAQKFKTNQIVLASWRLLFHVTFTLASSFGSLSKPVKHHSSAICVMILCLGAIHQLLTFVFTILYFIIREIIKLRQQVVISEQKVQNQPFSQVISENIKQKLDSVNFLLNQKQNTINQQLFTSQAYIQSSLIKKKFRLKKKHITFKQPKQIVFSNQNLNAGGFQNIFNDESVNNQNNMVKQGEQKIQKQNKKKIVSFKTQNNIENNDNHGQQSRIKLKALQFKKKKKLRLKIHKSAVNNEMKIKNQQSINSIN